MKNKKPASGEPPGRPAVRSGRFRLHRARPWALAALVLATPSAGAASPAADELTNLSLEQLLNVPVYAASKTMERASDSPSRVTVVTAEDIRRFGWRTLAEVLRSIPGFYTFNDRTYEYPGVRGFGRPGDYGSRLLIMIDGYRTNDMVYDSGFVGTEALLDLDLVDRIEVVRGPGSSIYGSNAVFGVVNLITRSAGSVRNGEVAVGAGSFGSRNGRVTLGRRFEDGAGLLASVSGLSVEGSSLCLPPYASAANPGGCTSGTDYDDSRRLFGKYDNGGFVLTAAASERSKGIPATYGGATFNDPSNQQRDGQAFLNGEYRHALSGGGDASARIFYGDSSSAARLNFPAPPASPVLNIDTARGSALGTELKLVTPLNARNKLVAGIEYVNAFRQSQFGYDESPYTVYLDSRTRSQRMGVYAQNEFQWSPQLRAVFGLRWDKYSELSGQVNPRLGLVWQPTERTVARIQYGSAFRAPNVYERFYVLSGNSIANPALRPEKIDTLEASLEHYVTTATRLGVGAYQYRMRDLINQQPVMTTDPFGAPIEVLQFQNVNGAVSRGLDLSVEHLRESGARLRASVDMQRTEDNQGAELTNSPRRMAKLLASTPLPWAGLQAGVEGLWLSSRLTDVGTRVPSYGLVNLTLWRPRQSGPWEFSASVFNLLDRSFFDPLQFDAAVPGRDRMIQDGRAFRFRAVYHF